jgi:colanic acid biosynthesis glycosyl transferase WcaI
MSHPAKKTLLIISQVYAPDPAAVGQHVTDVAEEMTRRGWRVVVYTSARGYDDPSQRYLRRERRGGVDVRRLPLSSFGKRSIAIRLLAQSFFLLQATVLGLMTRQLELVLVSTSPPFAGLAGTLVSFLRRAPLIWWVMDLNPDQMIAAGKLSELSLPARLFDWINRCTMRRSRDIVVLDRFMKDRVLAKLPAAEKVRVLPPWPHQDRAAVPPSKPNAFRSANGLENAFIVMYSGNHAIQHPLDTLLDAAAELESDPQLRFVFIGGGAGKAAVDARVAAGARNLVSLPYQPLERVADSLAAADVHVVSMGNDMVGIVHPCKIYGAIAAGRPILFFGPQHSHVAELLRDGQCGYSVRHGDTLSSVTAIKALMSMSDASRQAINRKAAQLSTERFRRAELLNQFCNCLERDATPCR